MTNGKRRVLIAEDEPAIRVLLADVLASEGYEVLEARDGQEALELIEDPDGIQLVVTDINMPSFSGFDVADHARAVHPQVPVIFISGLPDQFRSHVINAPFRWFPKPFRIETLMIAVREMLPG